MLMRSFPFAITARAIWLALLIYGFATQGAAAFLFYAIPFVGSSFLLYLAWERNEYATLDTLVSLTFATALAVQLFFTWQTSGTLAFDKLFHALGGMCLAWFASIAYRGRIQPRWAYALAILTFAVAVGAAWETFEWVMSLLPAPYAWAFNPAGLADSFGDLIADGVGGLIIAGVVTRNASTSAKQ
jgi:hypothetical protein